MNPGPVEEGAAVAKETVKALQNYPVLLILVIFQIVMIGAIGWSVHERTLSQDAKFKLLVESCFKKQGLKVPSDLMGKL